MASPEYTTMIECTVELTEDFGNNLQEIASLLHSKHLISPSVKEQALHSNHELPTMRANKLVSVLTSRVQIQPEAFEQIVELMDPRYFSLSLAALKRQYKQNSGKDLKLPTAPSNPPQNGYHHQAPPGTAPEMHPPHHPTHHNQTNAYEVANNAKQVLKRTDFYNDVPGGQGSLNPHFEEGTTYQHDQSSHYTTPATTRPTEYHTARETNTPLGDTTNTAPTLDSVPDADELLWLEGNGISVRLIARVASEWEDVALNLGIQRYVLRAIKRDYTKCEDACTNMFQRWLFGDGKGPRTWGRVLTALEGINDNETAYLIRQVLGEHSH